MGNAFATPEVRRPAFLADEEQKMTGTPSPLRRMTTGGGFSGGRLHPGVYGGVHNGMHGYGAMPDLVMAILHQAQQENERLRTEYASMAGELDSMRRAKLELGAEKETQNEKADFETPESQLEKKQKSSEVDLEEERMGLYDVTPMEQLQKLQTMMDEAVEPKPEVEDRQVLHAAHSGEFEKVLQKAQDRKNLRRLDARSRSPGARGSGARNNANKTKRGNATQDPEGQERMQKQMDVMTRMMMHLLENEPKEDD